MKKRCMAGFLSVLLCLSLVTTSFAAEEPQMITEEGGQQTEVSGTEDQESAGETQFEEDAADTGIADAGKEEEPVADETEPEEEPAAEEPESEAEAIQPGEEEHLTAAAKEQTSSESAQWTAEDFTYTEMSERLYGCDYSREFVVSGIAVSGFSQSGLEKLEKNKSLVLPAETPEGVKIMGVAPNAFSNQGLTEVTFPEGAIVPYDDVVTHVVTERGNFIIGDNAFYKNNLTSLVLPEGVIAVQTSAFKYNQLETVTIPSTIWWMENSCFANNNLSTVGFPATCDFQCEIHAFAFSANRITSVRLPDFTMVVEKKAFLLNPGVESVPEGAPSGEEELGGVVYMYTDNPNLANMERIHHIDRKSEAQLSWHQKLIVDGKPEAAPVWQAEDFTYDGTEVTGLSEAGLKKSRNNKELILPAKTKDGKNITAVKGACKAEGEPFTLIQIPDTVVEIGEGVFEGCRISKLTLPSGIRIIGKNAFRGNEIKSLFIPGTVKCISEGAFAQGKAVLKELTFGEGTEEIEKEAFAGSALDRADLPDSLNILDVDAFKREAEEKIFLYTNTEKTYPDSRYHKVKRNLGEWNTSDFTYEGTTVTGFSETGKLKSEDNHNLVIPDNTPDGAEVTAIADTTNAEGLFACDFESVRLPSHLERIGNSAFRGNGIKKVVFPDTLKQIGNLAFQTNNLQEAVLPDSVAEIGSAAFGTNPNLQKIVLSKNLVKIPASAFINNSQAPYTELIIPEGVTSVDANAFAGNSIKRLEIPGTVKTVGKGAFSNGEGKEKLQELILHEGLETINSQSFGWASLETVDLPSTVKTLHKDAFRGNKKGQVTVYVDSMEQYENGKIVQEGSGHIVRIKPGPWNTEDFIYEGTAVAGFSEKGLLKREEKEELTIPDQTPEGEWVTEIADAAGTNGLFGGEGIRFKSLSLPAKLERIGVSAFRGNGIKEAVFPDTLKEIGNFAFHTNELTEVILPDSVETLGNGAFMTNPSIERIVLSENLKVIPPSAFMNSESAPYSELLIPEGITSIGNNAFAGNSMKRLEIPSSVETIGTAAFSSLEGGEILETLILNEGLTSIGSRAFHAAALRTVDLPSSVVKLNAAAFKGGKYGNVVLWANNQEQVDRFSAQKNNTFEIRNKSIFTYDGGTITGLSGEYPDVVLALPGTSPDGAVITELADAPPNQGGLFRQETGNVYREVVLPPALKRIGKYVFQDNRIEKIVFPEGLKEIGQSAFQNNHLVSVILPDSVDTLGAAVFMGNNPIAEVRLSNALKEIPASAFYIASAEGASHFTEITIPEGVEVIQRSAFGGNHFKNLTLPDSVITIADSAFAQTEGGKVLETLALSRNLKSIGNSAFRCSDLSYVTIPETLTELKKSAFANAAKGTVLLYSGNETHMEETAKFKPVGTGHKVIIEKMLRGGWSMEDFTYDGAVVTGWSKQGHLTRKGNLNLVIPGVNPETGEAITAIGNSAFRIPEEEWDQGHTGVDSVNGMDTVVIPATVTSIGEMAFQYNNLVTVDFPEGLVSIGGNAFNSNKMTAVSLPDTVTDMGAGAFSANNITEIKLSRGLTKLESGVFSSNIRLAHVDIPDTITEIGDFAFSGDRLEKLVIPKSVTVIGRAAFKLHHLTELTIPGNVKRIGDSAFEGTYKAITLKKLTLEEGIETIGSLAFRMGYLEEAVLPDSLKALAPNAFKNNTGYKESGIVKCFTSNPEHMSFETEDCQEILFKADWTADCFSYAGTTLTGFSQKGLHFIQYTTEVMLPDKNEEGKNITAISKGAFQDYGITKVTLPDNLATIEDQAFTGNKLTEVTLPKTIKKVGAHAFDKNVVVKGMPKEEEKPETGSGNTENTSANTGVRPVITGSSVVSRAANITGANNTSAQSSARQAEGAPATKEKTEKTSEAAGKTDASNTARTVTGAEDTRKVKENETPLANNAVEGWALINLAAVLLSAVLAIATVRRRSAGTGRKKERGMTAGSMIITAVSCFIFLLTQHMTGPMTVADRWTALLFILAVVNGVVFAVKYIESDREYV